MIDLEAASAATGLTFSPVPGLRPQDFNILCVAPEDPNSPRICLAKLHLISNVTAGITDELTARNDAGRTEALLALKLGEYSAWKHGVTCPNNGPCLVRKTMSESPVRQTAVSGVRKLAGLIGLKRD